MFRSYCVAILLHIPEITIYVWVLKTCIHVHIYWISLLYKILEPNTRGSFLKDSCVQIKINFVKIFHLTIFFLSTYKNSWQLLKLSN